MSQYSQFVKDLWDKKTEYQFFTDARTFASPDQLFYKTPEGKYVAYWVKGYKGKKTTLQSRNSLIGNFTEKWTRDLLSNFAQEHGLYAKQNVVCDEIGLYNMSPADVAFCKTDEVIQKPQNIELIIEVKMSVVWNWMLELNNDNEKLFCIGDFASHQGNPGLLRSDTMLKAIGKSINIRVSGFSSARIPILILGNTPITKSYKKKVDHLKKAGIIQGFWSINPRPRKVDTLKTTDGKGFIRMDTYEELISHLEPLLHVDKEFFSGMKSKNQLGRIIEIANKEKEYERKAEKFLQLIRGENNS